MIFIFVVPFSFFYQRITNFIKWFRQTFIYTPKMHGKRVAEIQKMVKEANAAGKKMCTARPTWQTMSIRKATFKEEMVQIPLNLNNILDLDKEQKTISVEPMVTMKDITRHLLPKGFALAVQVEMDDLTVGGLCMGIGIETSSHRNGFLFETIQSYEIITANGELIKVTKEERPDLFHTLPMSHGTLGFLVSVTLDIVAIGNYMKLRYIPCHSLNDFSELITSLSKGDNLPSYLEALVFNKSESVVMVGEMVNSISGDGKLNSVNRWYKPWFYTHVEKFLKKGESIEYIPPRHYFHRHTPSIFFQLRDLIPFANQAWYRWLFAWVGTPKISLMKYTFTKDLRKKAFENRVAQDILIPIEHLIEGIDLSDTHYGIYPLWVCPVKLINHYENEGLIRFDNESAENKMYVDIGIYGIPPHVQRGNWDSISTGRMLEAFTQSHGGFHMLYADIFMNREEFRTMFNHELYEKVRKKYGADKNFPEIYEKVIPEKWLVNLDQSAIDQEMPEQVDAN